jgi:hypothetical protein
MGSRQAIRLLDDRAGDLTVKPLRRLIGRSAMRRVGPPHGLPSVEKAENARFSCRCGIVARPMGVVATACTWAFIVTSL